MPDSAGKRSQDQNSGTIPVAASKHFDLLALTGWMAANVADFSGPLQLEQFKGGQSNPTYKLHTKQRDYVLRRKPPGELVKGAHAIEREVKVLTALEPTGFPVAHVHCLCQDKTVIGSDFYVMDMVEGRIIWDATLPDVPRDVRAAHYDAMNATLAQLHSIDPEAAGLADFGRAGNYFQRQISRWTQQYLADEAAGRDPHLDLLIDWLPAHIPPGDETSIVHGDFRIDNMIFHPTEPRILAVLDWELSTIGHPLADFAYHVMMYRMPPLIIAGLVGADLAQLGLPSEADYVASYCRRTGRSGIKNLNFYVAFNMFRLAAIFHGIKGRIARGTASSAHARDMVAALPLIAERAWAQARVSS
jgi:aminoglycoside phosphotransferase (APT) family kinase protein